MVQGICFKQFLGTDEHYRLAAELLNVYWILYPNTAESLKWEDTYRKPEAFFNRLFITSSAEIIGIIEYGHTNYAFDPDKYFVFIMVTHEYRNKGIGSVALKYIENLLLPRKPLSLETESDTRHPDSRKFLEKRGYHVKTKENVSALNLSAFEGRRSAKKNTLLEKDGYQFYSISDLDHTKVFLQKYFTLTTIIEKDVPWHGTYFSPEFEWWTNRFNAKKTLLKSHSIIAVKENAFVGLTEVKMSWTGVDHIYTGLSGVHPEHRRKGIISKLKLLSLSALKRDYKQSIVIAENEIKNPMYQINKELGFKKQYEILYYVKMFRANK